MQTLYGYFTTLESLKEVSRADLEHIHALDPAKHDFSDKALFESRKKLAIRLFNQNHFKSEVETAEQIEEGVLGNVNVEIQKFQKHLQSEARKRKTEMLRDAQSIYDNYLKFLILPIEFEHLEKLEVEKKKSSRATCFVDHPVIQKLKSSAILAKEVSKHHVSWVNEQDEIKDWLRKDILTADALEDCYTDKADSKTLILELFKKVIFKNKNTISHLESQHLHWSENQSIVKSMVLKTIKGLTEEGSFELADLTKNGKEDFDFFEQLFDGAIGQSDFLDDLIASKTQNWDIDRIALADRIILKVALVEMMNCPSIPMKVSINEAIEISKLYSTPKSKQFINGVLDVLSNELTLTGKVHKSGRGLIDNK